MAEDTYVYEVTEEEKKKADKSSLPTRIRYADPNDYQVTNNGVPLTPDYTDFCISFDLVVRRAVRSGVDVDGSSFNETSFHFQATSNNTGVNMGHKEGDEGPYFQTVYYTDINKEDYGNREIAEGLGVTNIEINYDNFYCPIVKMRMIDVRGSSLFGVEETSHDNYGKVKRDNLYSAFFTMPYPEFQLQIKGFYGQAVTFQLCCTDFRGEFNSDTGNFEADVTFLGYDYGLLAEIPFRYVVAAPLCEYYGADYWDNHVNSDAWMLSDNQPPIKLYDLAQNIERALEPDDNNDSVMGQKVSRIAADDEAYLASLTSIMDALNAFKDDIKTTQCKDNGYWYLDIENGPFFLFSAKKGGNVISVSKRDDLKKAIADHNQVYDGDIDITLTGDISFNPASEWGKISHADRNEGVVKFVEDDANKNVSTDPSVHMQNKKLDPSFVKGIKILSLFSGGIYDVMGKDESKRIQEENYMIYNSSLSVNDLYGAYFDVSKLSANVSNKINDVKAKIDNIRRNVVDMANNGEISIRDVIGTTPNIGNVFKIVMCHVETFLHMFYSCVDNIVAQRESGDDVRKKGGCETDIPGNVKTLYPFPGLTKKDSRPSDDDTSGSNTDGNVLCYTVDCENGEDFEETKFVEALLKALKIIQADPDEQNEAEIGEVFLPVAPFDCVRSDIPDMCGDTVDSVAGYLAMRAAILFGVVNNGEGEAVDEKVCEVLGRMEGYNYFKKVGDKDKIKKTFFDSIGDNTLSAVFKKISVCDSSVNGFASDVSNAGSFFAFERNQNVRGSKAGRQQIFTDSDGNGLMTYIYSRTKDNYAIIPEGLNSFAEYANGANVKYPAETAGTFGLPLSSDPQNFDYISCRSYVNGFGMPDLYYFKQNSKTILNKYNFEIYAGGSYGYGDEVTEKTRNAYRKMQSGIVECGGYKGTLDFTSVLERHWDISEGKYGSMYSEKEGLLASKYELEDTNMFPEDYSGETSMNGKKIFLTEDLSKAYGGKDNLSSPYMSSGVLTVPDNEVESEDVWIPEMNVYDSYTGEKYSVFGHLLYYMQNGRINDKETRERAKCLLFLHSLNYNLEEAKKLFEKNDNIPGKIKSAPYGLLLLLGGLIWRRRQANDPIISEVDNVPYKFNVDKDYSLMFKRSDGFYSFVAIRSNGSDSDSDNLAQYVKVDDIVPKGNNYITNRLELLFKDFVKNQWDVIRGGCEIYHYVNNSERRHFTAINFYNDILKQLGGEAYNNPNESMVVLSSTDFTKKYSLFSIGNSSENNWFGAMRLLFRKTNSKFQTLLKNVYSKEVIIADTSYFKDSFKSGSKDKSLKITESCFLNYINGFAAALNDVTGGENTEAVVSTRVESGNDIDYEAKLSIYLYLKHMWDKWLLHDYYDKIPIENGTQILAKYKYDVQNYFARNFVFIDSYYVNIYQLLKVNCNKLLTLYDDNVADAGGFVSLFLNKVAAENKCLMFGFPGYGFFANYDDEDESREKIRDLFKPIPYANKDRITTINKFAVIYVNKVSDIESSCSEYKTDSFDIWSGENTNISSYTTASESLNCPEQLYFGAGDIKGKPATEVQMTRYGYYVPSFGVAYSRSNNSIFKKVGINMSTPMVTQQTATVMQQISELGGTNSHKVALYGQDLYNIYSNYSYTCDIEMMGNVQIMPLMYFQLTNIPMFRGTYMVVGVNHSMQPGRMVTRIRGFKLSKTQLPYNRDWFTRVDDNKYFSSGNNYTEPCSSAKGDGTYPEIKSGEAFINKEYSGNDSMWHTIKDVKMADGMPNKKRQEENMMTSEYDANIAEFLNNTINPLLALYRETHPGFKKFTITSGLRIEKKFKSYHNLGLAVDIQFPGSKEPNGSGRDKNLELYNILVNSRIPFDKVILEEAVQDSNGKCTLKPRWIHIQYNPEKRKNRYVRLQCPNPTSSSPKYPKAV